MQLAWGLAWEAAIQTEENRIFASLAEYMTSATAFELQKRYWTDDEAAQQRWQFLVHKMTEPYLAEG